MNLFACSWSVLPCWSISMIQNCKKGMNVTNDWWALFWDKNSARPPTKSHSTYTLSLKLPASYMLLHRKVYYVILLASMHQIAFMQLWYACVFVPQLCNLLVQLSMPAVVIRRPRFKHQVLHDSLRPELEASLNWSLVVLLLTISNVHHDVTSRCCSAKLYCAD